VYSNDALAVLGVYAVPLVAFGAFFATPVTLFVILVLAIMYFGLLGGGLLLSGGRRAGEPGCSFAEFLEGRRGSIATSRISGRQVVVQMVAVPLALFAGATMFDLIGWIACA